VRHPSRTILGFQCRPELRALPRSLH
jgi:hypothetical protein